MNKPLGVNLFFNLQEHPHFIISIMDPMKNGKINFIFLFRCLNNLLFLFQRFWPGMIPFQIFPKNVCVSVNKKLMSAVFPNM